jgi:cyclopropane-fatty-acyl-phospholipid synthase
MFLVNRANLDDATTWASSIFSGINFLMNSRFVNSVSNAINNISAHYDISNDMFASFLSKDMTYSCAIFESKDESLETAQYRKLDRVIRQARLQPEDHVLEIGSGWGSFAIRAVQKTGCRVTTLTLSIEQKVLAEERIRASGLQDKISVVLCDYRKHVPEKSYDKIVSIEMIEAVGKEFLETYFAKVDECLKKDGGIAVFQVITMPETRYQRYCNEVDFIRKWVHLTLSSLMVDLSWRPLSHCIRFSVCYQRRIKGNFDCGSN